MKRLIAILCTATLGCVALTACSGAGESSGGTTKVALMMSHLSNSFTTTVSEAAKAKGKELGIEVTVFDAKQDVSVQIGQIESAVSQGFKGILVEPVSQEGITPGLKAANNANVPIGTLVQQAKDQDMAKFYVGGDDKAAGKLEMEEAIKAIGGQGGVAVLTGPMGSDGQIQRSAGYQEVLDANPGVQLLMEQTANWDTAEALKVTENWLSSGKDIKAIVSQNDSMGIGAMKAITDAGKAGQIQVFGVDATEDGINSIKSGAMTGTVSQDTAGIGSLAVETMNKVVKGETVEKVTFTKATWVTKDNADQFGKK